MLDTLVSQTANGLVLGFVYVLIAVGLSITFGLLGIINFAHGAFFALGAYVAYQLVQMFGWPAVVLAPLLVGGIGMVVEVLLIRRLYGKEPLLSLIVTFALALLIEALIRFFWGADGKPLASACSSSQLPHCWRCGAFCRTRPMAASCAPAAAIRRWWRCWA